MFLIVLTFLGFILPPIVGIIVMIFSNGSGTHTTGGGSITIDPLREDLYAGPIPGTENKPLEEKLKFMEGGVFQTPTEIWN